MHYPKFHNKHLENTMLEPQEYLNYLKSVNKYPTCAKPNGVIFCYQSSLMEYILSNHRTQQGDGFLSDLHVLLDSEFNIGILGNFGIGAPAAVVLLEELIAFGVTKFISIGSAGTLQKHINIGDVVICEKAIRDEGTSYHYLEPSKYAFAANEMTDKLASVFDKTQQPYHIGTSWTTDAPYRETIAEARQYQQEGVMTVEMEAAALFAVAQHRGVKMGAMFTISDSLADLKWRPAFHHQKTTKGLETLYQAAIQAIL